MGTSGRLGSANAFLQRLILVLLILLFAIFTPQSTARSQSLDLGEIDFVQFLLIWTGDYHGMVDGILGPQSEKAMQAFLSRRFGRLPETITEQHFQTLIADASETIEASGFKLHRNSELDLTFGLPEEILRPAGNRSTSLLFRSPDQTVELEIARLRNQYVALDQLYRKLTSVRGRTIDYSTFRSEWFVLSGQDRDRRFYVRYHGPGRDIRGFSISFTADRADELEPVIIAMSNVFRPSATATDPLIRFIEDVQAQTDERVAPEASVPSGFVVAEKGRFLTAGEIRNALSGIVLDGVYPGGSPFSETYFDDGRIRYFDADGSDSGRWSIERDTFCATYKTLEGACFLVEREGSNCFNFFAARESEGRLYRSNIWGARGWSRDSDPTCTTPVPQTADNAPDPDETFSGSGFVISREGTIVTNAHVVEGCKTLEVTDFGMATVLAMDTDSDLAVLRVTGKKPTSIAKIQLEMPELGQQVVVLGYPLSALMGNALSVTSGFISSLSGLGGDKSTYTLSANIQPGNSGGPVLDMHGNIIGVAVSKLDELKMLEAAGTTGGNIGFAINIKSLLEFLGPFKTETTAISATKELSVRAIAARGKHFTVQIVCRN